ncbi:MAG TPA: hypothetical protein VGR22_11240 [Thermomicrobiales bacterium]|nr:hypothetical protein [Thermomicrobiales bacterium]
MIAPDTELGLLLTAMGEYQDQQHASTGDHTYPTMVCADWAFHEARTGLGRERICRLLPQLVGDGLARGLGAGMVWGYRVSDGYAWIAERGQLQRSQWRQPLLAPVSALGPEAEDQLRHLLESARASGVTTQEIGRLEALFSDIAEAPGLDGAERDANLGQVLREHAGLSAFMVHGVLPFLRHVVAA